MSNNDSHQDSSVENENKNENESESESKSEDGDGNDSQVSPEVLAESIRNKTDALHAQGFELADQLERMAEADEDDGEGDGEENGQDGEVDPAAMMTELLETASDLIEVAHAIEDARLQDRSD